MKYIIMCGGNYKHWETPRHLSIVKGEELVARTIRLLKENGIKDIAISTDNPVFEKFGVPILKHDNLYIAKNFKIEEGNWFNCFYPTDKPACYIFGDVYFSDEAIKTIINTKTDDIEFFGSKPPFASNYIKTHEEPFALKVVNQKHLREAIEKTKQLEKEGKFWRKPIMWELWTVIKETPLQIKKDNYPAEYVVINDYTCDIDWKEDIINLKYKLGGFKMVKVQVIEEFTLKDFDKIEKSLIRGTARNEKGHLYLKDTFECDKEMAEYLTGGNAKNKVVVKVIEVIPEEIIIPEAEMSFSEEKVEPKVEVKITKKSKKNSKKASKKEKE